MDDYHRVAIIHTPPLKQRLEAQSEKPFPIETLLSRTERQVPIDTLLADRRGQPLSGRFSLTDEASSYRDATRWLSFWGYLGTLLDPSWGPSRGV